MLPYPMPSEARRSRRAGARRRQDALGHVINVLVERGFHQTRFMDVAAASGVAVSTLQVYFGSREDMLVEALRTSTEAEVAAMEARAGEQNDPWRQLAGLVDRGLATPVPVWRMLMEFWTAAAHDEELREHSRQLQARYRAPFESVLREGVQTGAFHTSHDPGVIADLIVTTLDGLLYPRVLDHPLPSIDGLRALLLDQLRTTLEVAR